MSERERLIFDGVVTDSCRGKFKVQLNENSSVNCVLSGAIKKNSIRIIVGDKVKVEVSEHDLTQGRIIFRYK